MDRQPRLETWLDWGCSGYWSQFFSRVCCWRARVRVAVDTDPSGAEHGFVLVLGDGESREFMYAEVQRLEIGKTGNHKLWGGLVGFGVGAIFAEATQREYQVTRSLCRQPITRRNLFGECADTYRGTVTMKEYRMAGVIAVLAAPALGYLLGRRLQSDVWEEVPDPANSAETGERFTGNANRLVLNPMVNAWSGRDGNIGVILGIQVRF